MLLAALRYLTATLNFLLATALIGPFFLGVISPGTHLFPEEIASVAWILLGSCAALTASVYLILPRTLDRGLRWHTRVVLLWPLSGIVFNTISYLVALRWGHRCYTALVQWETLAFFAACALLWATPGWLIATLARRNPNAA